MGKIIEIVKQIEENSVNKSKVDKLDNHSERSGKYNTIDRIAKTVK